MALETLVPRPAPPPLAQRSELSHVFCGGGELGERMRALDWTATALGPVRDWPQSLRTSISICLGADVPIALFWGPELVLLYNDAYRELLGERHPAALGACGRDVWPDAGPVLERVLAHGTALAPPPEPSRSPGPGPAASSVGGMSYSPIRDESGAIAGVYCTASASPLRLQSDETFLRLLAHDLRNPLSAIATAAQLLALRADTPRITTPVSRILDSAERLEHMIVQLVDVARLRWGAGLELERARVDLAELAREVVAEFGANPSCPIRVSSAGDLSGHWDRERLRQLLLTLTTNAARHGTFGAPITLHLDGSATGVVELEAQNGGAITDELQAAIFEPLEQGKRVQREGSNGLGLGLYLARQIVFAHGGSIQLDSDAAKGTRFRVTLPRDLPIGAG